MIIIFLARTCLVYYLFLLVAMAEMVHESIRKNAAHFMTLMPMFSQRLAQRDYDLILVSPLRKRLLLRMYIIGKALLLCIDISLVCVHVFVCLFECACVCMRESV
jgi:hypothetical protein